MNKHPIASRMGNIADESKQIHMVQTLQSHINDNRVLEGLCAMAVSPIKAKVREAILAALAPVAGRANQWFVRAAGATNDTLRRRLALVNLSLMECTTPDARAVVLQGLADPDVDVQYAAALCSGLFDDSEFLVSVTRFLDRNLLVNACASAHCTIAPVSAHSDCA